MPNSIFVITPPDDSLADGLRILLVGLTNDQSDIVSKALMGTDATIPIMAYMWSASDQKDWLFDKKSKSTLIIFNAELNNDVIVGYLAAHPNAYYFGTLKDLQIVNNKVIYTVDDCSKVIEEYTGIYERHFK
jgi:hypothetical protein